MAPPKRGLFRDFEFRLNPPKDGTPTGAGKRGRADSPPAAPRKKPRTRAGAGATLGGVGAGGPTTAPAADPIPVEEQATGKVLPAAGAPATGAGMEEEEAPPASSAAPQVPTAPAMRAGVAVVDLGSDVEDAGTREEPEEDPTPSSTAPDTTVAVPTVAPEAELGDVSRAVQADDADPAVSQQEALPAEGADTPTVPQLVAAGVEEAVAGEQQEAPPQGDDAPPGQTVVAGASSSSAATTGLVSVSLPGRLEPNHLGPEHLRPGAPVP
ncbi:melanocyte protein PMEL-like [Brachypodium distachyon]|uniref:melanocyte protein PMEL-like n=1 Tax=Brachypodium distachyon TaxID=15368 RepID=UPI00052FF9FF|nr:melanocyte protein PMEL-like [Brachypodium distachyon]|eukprot:XP_010233273.1 melanocyte protein PMEL-like [Brachypodium distachyon]